MPVRVILALSITGKRFRCNLISTITNRGRLCFKVFTQHFDSAVMLDFLRRLLRQTNQKIFLIVDGHPAHKSRAVKDWVERHAERIRLFFLPSYSPELNPDELFNHDVKANAVGRQRAKNKTEMMKNLALLFAQYTTSTKDCTKLLSRETRCLCSRLVCSLFNALGSNGSIRFHKQTPICYARKA